MNNNYQNTFTKNFEFDEHIFQCHLNSENIAENVLSLNLSFATLHIEKKTYLNLI